MLCGGFGAGRPSSGFYGRVGAKLYETTSGRETAAKDG